MANLCSNYLVFEGNQKAIRDIHALFQYMKEQEEATGRGQLPEFLSEESGYFFELYWNEDDLDNYQYTTRWAPNTEVLLKLATHFNVDFTLDYEEMGCLVYGRAAFIGGTLTDICLENEDFDTYLWDEQEDTYQFEGETYYSQWEILDILLERRWRDGTTDEIQRSTDE